jgi:spore coat polysaccharide biosynthesis protein SpsF
MNTVAIIQARMGSSRLPGKVLLDIHGKSMLARVVSRVRLARTPDTIVVASTTEPEDRAIVRECELLRIPAFRGSRDDVLDRYYRAAGAHEADTIIRITSDCPLLDPDVVDATVTAFRKTGVDYASNTVERSFPLGLDVEAFSLRALRAAWELATKPYERAHVTPYIWRNPDRFRAHHLKAEADHSGHRWTVDTEEDLAFVRAVYARLRDPDGFRWRDVLEVVAADPSLEEMNRHVRQKAVEEG